MSLDSHRATVYAGITATDYVRAGNGETVLLLTWQHAEHPLFVPLTRAFRVIAPELPCRIVDCVGEACRSPSFALWLRDFLDGLGIPRVSIVADESFALDAFRFSLTEPTRVDRVAVVIRDSG